MKPFRALWLLFSGWVCRYCGTYNESGKVCQSCRQPK